MLSALVSGCPGGSRIVISGKLPVLRCRLPSAASNYSGRGRFDPKKWRFGEPIFDYGYDNGNDSDNEILDAPGLEILPVLRLQESEPGFSMLDFEWAI